MKLTAPKLITWGVAVGLTVIGLVAQLVDIPPLTGLAFWLVLLGAVILIVATVIEEL